MVSILKSPEFDAWLRKLKDSEAKARIMVRISRLSFGNAGDMKPVGEGISEMRIEYGPGYRVYFKRRSREIVILLAGGSKATQAADIKTALRLARDLQE